MLKYRNFLFINHFLELIMEYRKYICIVCGLIYDEAEGWPEDGIEPGTRWEDVPENWECPDCGVSKDEFELLEE
ncbi:Rubredoxin [Francisella tularensis subsp. holarctica LVS]|uniref:Rubredoxin n=3 Tax=Francisella tularensis subsp. holarctica TaxID=119857 RepID=A0ABF7PS42_FRATH|nr:Rubredoxin [Francisella tularensis subsp. holarctica LVS]